MAKNLFAKGDLVSGKRWSGTPFLGVYEHGYDDGSYCVFDGNKYFNVKVGDLRMANEEESKIIKETIIKPMKNANKASQQPKTNEVDNLSSDDEKSDSEALNEALSE